MMASASRRMWRSVTPLRAAISIIEAPPFQRLPMRAFPSAFLRRAARRATGRLRYLAGRRSASAAADNWAGPVLGATRSTVADFLAIGKKVFQLLIMRRLALGVHFEPALNRTRSGSSGFPLFLRSRNRSAVLQSASLDVQQKLATPKVSATGSL